MQRKRLRILFVDDDEDTCFLIRTLLGPSGYEVVTAKSVGAALLLAERERFDLFVIDNRFPDGKGTDLCRKLCHIAPAIPTIFLSGDASAEDRHKALEAGAKDYLIKPGGVLEITDVVRAILC